MGASGLGSLLVKEGFLTEQDRQTITKTCGQGSWAFAKSIIAMGLLDEDELAAFFAERTRFQIAPKDFLHKLDQDAVNSVDRRLVSKLEMIPLRRESGKITVGVVDPLDRATLKQLEFFTGLEVNPVVVPLSQLYEGLHKIDPEFRLHPTALTHFLHNHAQSAWVRQKLDNDQTLGGRASPTALSGASEDLFEEVTEIESIEDEPIEMEELPEDSADESSESSAEFNSLDEESIASEGEEIDPFGGTDDLDEVKASAAEPEFVDDLDHVDETLDEEENGRSGSLLDRLNEPEDEDGEPRKKAIPITTADEDFSKLESPSDRLNQALKDADDAEEEKHRRKDLAPDEAAEPFDAFAVPEDDLESALETEGEDDAGASLDSDKAADDLEDFDFGESGSEPSLSVDEFKAPEAGEAEDFKISASEETKEPEDFEVPEESELAFDDGVRDNDEPSLEFENEPNLSLDDTYEMPEVSTFGFEETKPRGMPAKALSQDAAPDAGKEPLADDVLDALDDHQEPSLDISALSHERDLIDDKLLADLSPDDHETPLSHIEGPGFTIQDEDWSPSSPKITAERDKGFSEDEETSINLRAAPKEDQDDDIELHPKTARDHKDTGLNPTSALNEIMLKLSLSFGSAAARAVLEEYLPQIGRAGCLVNLKDHRQILWNKGAIIPGQLGPAAIHPMESGLDEKKWKTSELKTRESWTGQALKVRIFKSGDWLWAHSLSQANDSAIFRETVESVVNQAQEKLGAG